MRMIFLQLIFLFILLHSCGEDQMLSAPKDRTPPPLSTILLEQGCVDGRSDSKAAGEVETLMQEYRDFSRTHNGKGAEQLERIDNMSDHFKSSWNKPHVMSEKVISESVEKIRKQFKSAQEKTDINVQEMNEIAHSLVRLRNLSARWSSQQCALASLKYNVKDDMRTFLKVKDKKESYACLEAGQVSCDQAFVDELKKDQGDMLLGLCEKFHKRSVCAGELRAAWYKESLKFFNHYYKKNNEVYNDFFRVTKKRTISCVKQAGVNILIVPVRGLDELLRRLSFTRARLEQNVNDQWGSDSLKIQFQNVQNNELFDLVFHDKFISQVSNGEKMTMTLSSRLINIELLRVFNHELGHIFGFPDCYVEFYHKQKGELIYYTLDAQVINLMCEIGPQAIVPDSYRQELVQRHCL